ncbi:MAG TPA: hypothetical protein VHZ78_02135 [Rhizomicrobium sp.]|jgi:hypothetical protein|nr:hypothetical protein [Rhizomicrobium sp.]
MNFRVFLASLTVLLAVAGSASARGTLDSILPGIRAQHPGRLSDAEPWTDSEGRTHYRIKWMTPEGRILFFNADADSGRYTDSGGGDVGRQWRGDGGRRGGDDQPANENNGGNRSHWNGDGGDDNGGSGDWRARHGGNNGGGDPQRDGGGDWRDRQGGGETGGGDRQRGQGDWNRGGGRGSGGWHSGGDNGGGGHHHHGDN